MPESESSPEAEGENPNDFEIDDRETIGRDERDRRPEHQAYKRRDWNEPSKEQTDAYRKRLDEEDPSRK
jgi:hypothetical protein